MPRRNPRSGEQLSSLSVAIRGSLEQSDQVLMRFQDLVGLQNVLIVDNDGRFEGKAEYLVAPDRPVRQTPRGDKGRLYIAIIGELDLEVHRRTHQNICGRFLIRLIDGVLVERHRLVQTVVDFNVRKFALEAG